MSEITISSISEFVHAICELNTTSMHKCPFGSEELLFRGHADKSYELIPSIGRARNYVCDCTLFNEERNLIDLAKFKIPDIFRSDMSPVELLALLQHHGIPTRLLDITENALVALYFACCKEAELDGEVIIFKVKSRNVTTYPVINAIADSYRFTQATFTSLESFFGNVKRQPYFLEQQRSNDILFNDDAAGGAWIEECCQKIQYIYAPFRSSRQHAQQGRYILFPNRISREIYPQGEFSTIIDPIPKTHDDIVMRIVISHEAKSHILSELSVFGVKRDKLFCDNTDIVCEEIVNLFKSKYA